MPRAFALSSRRILARCALAVLALAGCATPPPPPPPEPAPAPPPQIIIAPAPACPTCDDQIREVARLRQDLAAREQELRDLRATQREQTRSVQETTREVTRAKAKARRLATQADAASYMAEVEVALGALRAAPGAAASPLPALAGAFLDSAAEPFARGDYGTAMDRASQAEQIVALAMDTRVLPAKSSRAPGEWLLQVALPLRVTADSHLRRQPKSNAPALGIVKKDSALLAHAYKGGWMRVETEDGRMGWVDQAQLVAR
jgi:hypothetical protein